MGLLDQIAGQISGNPGGQNEESGSQGNLVGGVMALINSAGGLPALLQKFQASGLGDKVASWVGHGENQPVSPNEVRDAIGQDGIDQVAQQGGTTPEEASAGLARYLPQIVDKLTPNGQVPENNDMVQQGLNMLKGRLFQ
jgi:uncharacterized protein YidB (DUF937 family)